MLNPREAAYLALVAYHQEDQFLNSSLDQWKESEQPSTRDYQLAQQLAYGTCQMALALDYLGKLLSDKGKLNLKAKERLLLRLALYQYYYLSRIPLYAIADQMVALAKKYGTIRFANFLNALFRKLSQLKEPLQLPSGNRPDALSIRYSYPEYFVKSLLSQYDLATTKEILSLGNTPSPIMFRVRPETQSTALVGVEKVLDSPCTVFKITDLPINEIIQSNHFYIQNVTPAYLISSLCQKTRKTPKTIIDLCAAPGGKTVAVADYFPNTSVYANDISQEKMIKLSENCQKYGVHATLSMSPAEKFYADERFDVIILDLPCTNTGVLNKRPEARWRLSEPNTKAIIKLQSNILSHAINMLAPKGEIWFMTCSILEEENETLVAQAAQALHLSVEWQEKILPNAAGWDGGFAALLRKN